MGWISQSYLPVNPQLQRKYEAEQRVTWSRIGGFHQTQQDPLLGLVHLFDSPPNKTDSRCNFTVHITGITSNYVSAPCDVDGSFFCYKPEQGEFLHLSQGTYNNL